MFIGLNFGMCTYVHIEKNQQPYARFRIIQVFLLKFQRPFGWNALKNSICRTSTQNHLI